MWKTAFKKNLFGPYLDPDDYVDFLDSVVCGNLQSEEKDLHLYDLVQTFQMLCHSKTCRKYKNMTCFKFGRFFTEKTVVVKPVQSTLSQVKKFEILKKRSNILRKAKKYNDTYLDPNSKHYSNGKFIQEIIFNIEITEIGYYWTLSILPETDHVINLKRSPGSCFVNNYNPVLLKAWEVNIDIKSAHNYYKALTYIIAYFSKSDSEVSESLKQAARKIKKRNFKCAKGNEKNIRLLVHINCLYKNQYIIYCLRYGFESGFQEFFSSILTCHKIG